jgi:hypothetical protein
MTKICLILAMLRQAGQVNTAKNMKFREMVNTADYQVSPLFSYTAKKIRFMCSQKSTARPLSQFLRPRSFLSGNIFFPIFGTVYLQCIQLYIFHHNKLCVCAVGLKVLMCHEMGIDLLRTVRYTVRKPNLCILTKKECAASVPILIYVSVSDSYFPRIGPHIWLPQNRQMDPGKYKYLRDI